MKFREQLDNKRIQKGLTVSELSRQTGLTKASVSRIINGRTNPQPRSKIAIARALESTVEELFGEVE